MAVPALLKSSAARFNVGVTADGIVGFDFTILLSLLPIFSQLAALCKKQPPPNPNPAASDNEQRAYVIHWQATTNYVGGQDRYRSSAVNTLARSLKQQKKKKGEPIKGDEARALAIRALDEARLNDVPALTAAFDAAG